MLVSNIFPFFLKFAARATDSPGLMIPRIHSGIGGSTDSLGLMPALFNYERQLIIVKLIKKNRQSINKCLPMPIQILQITADAGFCRCRFLQKGPMPMPINRHITSVNPSASLSCSSGPLHRRSSSHPSTKGSPPPSLGLPKEI